MRILPGYLEPKTYRLNMLCLFASLLPGCMPAAVQMPTGTQTRTTTGANASAAGGPTAGGTAAPSGFTGTNSGGTNAAAAGANPSANAQVPALQSGGLLSAIAAFGSLAGSGGSYGATTTTSAKPYTAAAGTANVPSTSAKKGLGMWGTAGSQGSQVGAGWYYNWNAAPTMGDGGNLEYVPMIWSGDRLSSSVIAQLTSSGAKALLGFNEPDHSDQANMSVASAISLWPQLMQTGLRLGSPAAASANGTWIQQFMQQAQAANLRVDFMAVHYYPDASDPNAVATFQATLQSLYNTYKLPIWVTEFGICSFSTNGTLSDAQVSAFVTQTVTMLQSLSFVERYSWFSDKDYGGCEQSAVFSGSGLSTAGQAYSTAGQ